MAENSKIAWCDHTFNPWRGCQPVSPGCANCYAARDLKRFGVDCFGPGKTRIRTKPDNWRKPLRWNRQAQTMFSAWAKFKAEYPGMTDRELLARGFIKPTRPKVFCASMADVFDNAVPNEWRRDLFSLIELTPHLDWLLLTKRIDNVRGMVADARVHDWLEGRKNVWLGSTICNQPEAERDISKLLAIRAAKHFISLEPLIGDIDLEKAGAWPSEIVGIDWVIVGGETGPNARPMLPQWVRKIRDQCDLFGTPFMLKQNGEWANRRDMLTYNVTKKTPRWVCPNKEDDSDPYSMLEMVYRVGKKSAGRLLDGREHMEFPEAT